VIDGARAATWETLGRLVGSADGKKLRVLAQSMALDVLLAHANHHHHHLSPRYQLVRRGGGSLALDVVDVELEPYQSSSIVSPGPRIAFAASRPLVTAPSMQGMSTPVLTQSPAKQRLSRPWGAAMGRCARVPGFIST
jgi:hypothetical protein